MTFKSRCLALILIITAAWVDDLQGKAGVIKLPVEPFAFEREFVLLSAELRYDASEKIELSHAAAIDFQLFVIEPNPLLSLSAWRRETMPCLLRSIDSCYLFMSMQC